MRSQVKAKLGIGQPKAPKRSKYGNRKTKVDGILFDSKREARHFAALKLAQKAGEIAGFCRQPRFDLPGGVIYIADFVVFHKDGTFEVQDVKSEPTRTKAFRIKARQMRSEHGIEVKLV